MGRNAYICHIKVWKQMAMDLKVLARDLIGERQFEAALQVLAKAYAERDFEARALMGDIYANSRYAGHSVHQAMVCYIEAQQLGVNMEAKILDLLQRDLELPDKLTRDRLMERLWEAFSKEPERYMQVISLLVVSQMHGYEPYVQQLIDACEGYLAKHPKDLQSVHCLSFLYTSFGGKADMPRLAELHKVIVDTTPTPDMIDLYLRNGCVYDPNVEPDEGLWHYIDQLEQADPEAYWYFSGVHYFFANRFAEAFQSFEVGTTRFGGRSQVALGYCYMYGIGTTKDPQKAIDLLTPLRYQYPVANMYLAHERMFREMSVKAFVEALGLDQLMNNEYVFESMFDCLWLCIAYLSRFHGGKQVHAQVKRYLDVLLADDHEDAFAMQGLLVLLKVLPEYTEEDADRLFMKGYARDSVIAALALVVGSPYGKALLEEGFAKVGRNKEVDPHLRAICYLNAFLNALVLGKYDVDQAEFYLEQVAMLEPAFRPHIEGLRLIGYSVGRIHDNDVLIERNRSYQAQYPDCGLAAIVEALLQGQFAEVLSGFVKDPALEADLVSAQVLAVLSTWLTDDRESQNICYKWVDKLAPLTDCYWVAEAFSGRYFPRDLKRMG